MRYWGLLIDGLTQSQPINISHTFNTGHGNMPRYFYLRFGRFKQNPPINTVFFQKI